jgi:hypothetical protein
MPATLVNTVGVITSLGLTVWFNAAEVLVMKLVSPPYTAVIECEPTFRDEVANVATPDPFSVPVPRVVVLSLKVTVPVGVPLAGELTVTVAVNVTVCDAADGFADEVTTVIVFAWLTTCDSGEAALSLPVKLLTPP